MIKKLSLFKIILLMLAVSLFSTCGKSSREKRVIETNPVSIKQYDTPPGADPSVPAELGGAGFTGEGWETKTDYNVIGNPDAVKGGSIILTIPDFPSTFRMVGKDANSYWNYLLKYSLSYEGLLELDPVTEEFIPALATHWKISDDKKEFTFRIDPDARWADGKPVVAEDVLETWKLQIDPGILEAYSNILYGSYEEPEIISKYIIKVRAKELNWRQFLYFGASLRIMPAHIIGGLSGKDYLEKFQFDFIPGSGAYVLDINEIRKGQSVSVRRRSDYWAEDQRRNIGRFNFDFIRFDVVTDKRLEFEKFKKGDIDLVDFTGITTINNWLELDKNEDFLRGVIQKRDVFNQYPSGLRGICFNMRRPPFDDIRIRKAFAHLFDRGKMIERLYHNIPAILDSYYANSVYENPDNPKIRYNFDEGVRLLAEAGWSEKNRDGYLVKDGRVFETEVVFGHPDLERFLTIYQEDMRNAGIKLNLRQVDGSTNFQIGNERNFSLIVAAWGGLTFPNPESSFGPGTADQPNTTNWPGVKDARIDELCLQYNVSFDRNERINIIREIDGILCSIQPYALSWYYPSQRIGFRNKFGFPEGILSRTDNVTDAIPVYWFVDPEKVFEYDEAMKNSSMTLPQEEIVNKFWIENKQP
jgi:microcin C transport system substrate-binding protein